MKLSLSLCLSIIIVSFISGTIERSAASNNLLLAKNINLAINQDRAIDIFNGVIATDPNDAKFYFKRGIEKNKQGRYQDAIIDYNQGIILAPDFAFGYAMRASAKVELGLYQEAINDYDRFIALAPNNEAIAKFYVLRSYAKLEVGNKQGAIADMTTASEIFRQQNKMDDYQKTMKFVQEMKANK